MQEVSNRVYEPRLDAHPSLRRGSSVSGHLCEVPPPSSALSGATADVAMFAGENRLCVRCRDIHAMPVL